jgi:hypothetical protein
VARLQWDAAAIDLAPDARAWPGLPAARHRRLTTLLDDLADGALPGVREGVERVELDARWHIGFGLRCLIEARPSSDLLDDLLARAEDAAAALGRRRSPRHARAHRAHVCPAAVGRRAHRGARGGVAGPSTRAGRGGDAVPTARTGGRWRTSGGAGQLGSYLNEIPRRIR